MNLGQWLGLLAIVASAYILWQIRQLLLLAFGAVVLAIALNQLVRRLQHLGIKRGLAVLLSVILFFALVIGFFWLIVPPFAAQLPELTEQIPKGLERLENSINWLQSHAPKQLAPYLLDLGSLSQQAQPVLNQLLRNSVTFFSNSFSAVLSLLLVLVLTVMLLTNPHAYRQVFVLLFPSFYRRRVDGILKQCEVSLGKWLVGAIISMSVVGLISALGLSFLQIQPALALGIVAGFLNLIPNLGPTISVIPPMLIALLDVPWKSLAVLALYFAIQQIESNFLTPFIMAQQVSLLPAVTLLSQVIFATLFGFLGLLLAIPLTVVLQIWLKEVLIKDVLDRWCERSEGKNDDISI